MLKVIGSSLYNLTKSNHFWGLYHYPERKNLQEKHVDGGEGLPPCLDRV